MTDLRQGVTEPVHAVLDRVDVLRANQEVSDMSILDLLRHSTSFLTAAATAITRETERECAVQAAALAIIAVEAIGRAGQ